MSRFFVGILLSFDPLQLLFVEEIKHQERFSKNHSLIGDAMKRGRTPITERLISACFGITFGGIGLITLANLWLTPFGGFGSPPLFFRLFGTLIAIPFIGVGAIALYSAVTGHQAISMARHHLLQDRIMRAVSKRRNDRDTDRPEAPSQLACPSCGAPRSDEEASPSGDVKCSHCDRWYNMYSTDEA